MLRTNILAALGLLMFAAGCSMCAHPYDNCPPTYTGGDCSTCRDTTVRAGSILAPGYMAGRTSMSPVVPDGIEGTLETTPTEATPAVAPAPAPAPPTPPAPTSTDAPKGAWMAKPSRPAR